MDTNEMIALLLPPNGCFACSDTRKEIAEELARRSVDLERECADADKICAALGLTVDKSRTEGGSLNVPRIVGHIQETLTALRESHAFGVAMSDKYVASRAPECAAAQKPVADRWAGATPLRAPMSQGGRIVFDPRPKSTAPDGWQSTRGCGYHHYTPENIAAIVRDLKACEQGGEMPAWVDRDHRAACGILWRIISALSSDAAPDPAQPTQSAAAQEPAQPAPDDLVERQISLLRERDLGIAEFHAMQLPIAASLAQQRAEIAVARVDAERWQTLCNLWMACAILTLTQDEDGRWSIEATEPVDSVTFATLTGDDPDAAIDAARSNK